VIVVGATVILGLMFGITTRMQLMELAQLNHPLLRRLQEQASGTFHHSVIVGNLGERAADRVGADSLLVRVGCYFHDIGKVTKPGYYIENQMQGENPHDKLTPASSAKMVSDHVHTGLELAKRHRVPARVRAFIPEHHGTRLVTYFYRKAASDDATTDPEKFRYPGPKPQSRETAIVMLADSVEAVVRSSRDRSAERIDSLVEAVIAERVAEGQLNECDLTLRDLKTIGESFRTTLRGVYHPRIEYPAPTAAERATAAAVGGSPEPLAEPMDGTAPPLEIERPRS
jgi:putative nucleotidyltransferase with HDIG domain